MLLNGERGREHNLWVSKLRKYQTKHTQSQIQNHHVNREGEYTLHPGIQGNSEDVQPMTHQSNTDLQHCVQLLSHLLDTNGSIMGGPMPKRSATRTKKKAVHVVAKPKSLGKNAVIKSLSNRGASGKLQSGPHQRQAGMKRQALDGGMHGVVSRLAKELHWDDRETAVSRMARLEAERDADPVPYNTRIPSSTPNTTLVKELQPNAGDKQKSHKIPVTTNKSEYQCVHNKLQAPNLPLVFLNMDYSLTSGQSHPLNATDDVNIVKPIEAKPLPKLTRGWVDFRPNPVSWFHGIDPERQAMGQDSEGPMKTFLSKSWPSGMNLDSVPDSPEAQSGPDPVVDFSLYTNPCETTGAQLRDNVAKREELSLMKMSCDIRENTKLAENRQTTVNKERSRDFVHVSTGKVPIKVTRKNHTAVKEGAKATESKVKRIIAKESTSACPRCAKFDKKKIFLKNKENILQKTLKSQENLNRSLPADIVDAATQCSPEKAIKIPVDVQEPVTPVTVDPKISKSSMRHMQTLQRLLAEMKLSFKSEQNGNMELIMKQIEQTAAMFVPGLGGIDWQTELELALQPLRMENAQLRRRLRINNQQMKDKQQELEMKEKPDQTYQTVHSELQRHKLEKDLKEVSSSRDHLREHVKSLQTENEHLKNERTKLLEIMVFKDAELQKTEKTLTTDVSRYRGQLDGLKEEVSRILKDKEIAQSQNRDLYLKVENRDREIERLRNVVKNLQTSMTKLLAQLRDMTPPDDFSGIFMDDLGNDLLSERTLQAGHHTHSSPHTPQSRDNVTGHAARRSLPFSQSKSAKKLVSGLQDTHKSTKLASGSQSTKPEFSSPRPSTRPLNGNLNITSSPKGKRKSLPADSWDIDETDYILNPGSSPMKQYHPKQVAEVEASLVTPRTTSTHTSSSSPTVRELLTPLKDRMQTQYKRLSLASGSSLSTMEQVKPSAAVDSEAMNVVAEVDTDLEVEPLEVDSTLLGSLSTTEDDDDDDDNRPKEDQKNNLDEKIPPDEDSRYSMTDYFKKYPRSGEKIADRKIPQIQEKSSQSSSTETGSFKLNSESSREGMNRNDDQMTSDYSNVDSYNGPESVDQRIRPSDSNGVQTSQSSASGHVSAQGGMYKGTELDTSISTIDDCESITSSQMTDSSVSAIDDSAFRRGLADLDSNIAKIQEQLKINLAKYT